MADDMTSTEADQDAMVRNYFLVCMGAMLVLLLDLLRRGLGPWALLPVAVGVVGAAFRIRFAPLLTIIVVAATFMATEGEFGSSSFLPPTFNGSLPDWILSAAMLAFFVAHYRILGLTGPYFPPDESKGAKASEGASTPGPAEHLTSPRGAHSITPSELSWFVLSLPVWAMLAQLLWKFIPAGVNPHELPAAAWQGIVFAWTFGVGLFLVAGILGYVLWQQRTRREARLVLQDALWREICRDQRRVSRELTRARLTRRHGKEKP
jgi:hypothetical protein